MKINKLYTYLVCSYVVLPTSIILERLNFCFNRTPEFIFVFSAHFTPYLHYDFFFSNSFSFITNNIFFPLGEKSWKFFRNTFSFKWFFHLYSKYVQYQRRAEVINYQDRTETFFSNVILCTERTSYARDVRNE